MIHSVTGPVSAQTLLHEAKWAIEMYAEAKAKPYKSRLQYVASAHQQASWSPLSNQDRKVHELLATKPLPHLQLVYEEIFETILGQRVSNAGPRLAQASARLDYARRTGRPILFVLHDGHHWSAPGYQPVTRQLINQYAVIVMPLREAPALSQITGQPPFQSNGAARPLFVVARSDCEQVRSVSGSSEPALVEALAHGWADTLERRPPSVGALVRAQRLLRSVHPPTADRIRDLTIRVREEAQAERQKKLAADKLAAS